jgi:hypothetical protein
MPECSAISSRSRPDRRSRNNKKFRIENAETSRLQAGLYILNSEFYILNDASQFKVHNANVDTSFTNTRLPE